MAKFRTLAGGGLGTRAAVRRCNGQSTHGCDREGYTGSPSQVFLDAGYMADVVYAFCKERGEPFFPSIGRGATQQRTTSYHRPTSIGNVVRRIGEGYHLSLIRPQMVKLVEINADQWKTWVHQRLTTPLAESGAMSLFQLPFHEHLSFAKHLTAERKTEEFVPGKGVVTRWEQVRKQDHWLDALAYACCAGHVAGVRLLPENRQTLQKKYGKLSDLQRAKMREYGIEGAVRG